MSPTARERIHEALRTQRLLMTHLESAAGSALMAGEGAVARQVERVAGFARLLGVRLASLERQARGLGGPELPPA